MIKVRTFALLILMTALAGANRVLAQDDPDLYEAIGDTAQLEVGVPVERVFYQNGDVDRATFVVEEGIIYVLTIAATGTDVDPFVDIYESADIYKRIASDDDSGGDTTARVVLGPWSEAKAIFIVISNVAGNFGATATYQILIQRAQHGRLPEAPHLLVRVMLADQPVANAAITVSLNDSSREFHLLTNDAGVAACALPASGKYSVLLPRLSYTEIVGVRGKQELLISMPVPMIPARLP